jgi:hypothetical protein
MNTFLSTYTETFSLYSKVFVTFKLVHPVLPSKRFLIIKRKMKKIVIQL